MVERTCLSCETALPAPSRGRPRKFCLKCRPRKRDLTPRKPKASTRTPRRYPSREKPCARCGETIVVTPGKSAADPMCRPCRQVVRARKPKHCATCGAVCTGERCWSCVAPGPTRVGRVCEVCGRTYAASYSEQRTCGRECGQAIRTPPPSLGPKNGPTCRVWFAKCAVCANAFTARGSNAKYCSAQCRIDVSGARVNDLYGMVTTLGLNGMGWYDLLVDWLRERDGDQCGICLMAIDFTVRSGTTGSDQGRSVDHIVPRSLGGGDEPENLRLAHWGCNRRRSNRVDQEDALFAIAA